MFKRKDKYTNNTYLNYTMPVDNDRYIELKRELFLLTIQTNINILSKNINRTQKLKKRGKYIMEFLRLCRQEDIVLYLSRNIKVKNSLRKVFFECRNYVKEFNYLNEILFNQDEYDEKRCTTKFCKYLNDIVICSNDQKQLFFSKYSVLFMRNKKFFDDNNEFAKEFKANLIENKEYIHNYGHIMEELYNIQVGEEVKEIPITLG